MSKNHTMRTLAFGMFLAIVGCGGAALTGVHTQDVEAIRGRAVSAGAASGAPLALASGDAARARAKSYRANGDVTSAGIEDDRAIANYQRAIALTRASVAERALATATSEQTRTKEQLAIAIAEREKAERIAEDYEQKNKVLESLAAPDATQKSPEREAARLEAAKSFRAQAQLLCHAAGILGADTKAADDRLREAQGAPRDIDLATQARATCLSVLTQGRRAAGDKPGHPDALLGELASAKQWDVVRDERGVVVTLRSVFAGSSVTKPTEDALLELGRVAAAHALYKVQVAQFGEAPSPARKTSLEGALKNAKLPTSVVSVGDALPVSRDRAARNERVEIVFIHPAL
ncbi:MAG: hypothetical protein U0174_20425 [Polyangiaceae bacterium]